MYIWGEFTLTTCILNQNITICVLSDAYREAGPNPRSDELGAIRAIPLGNIHGLVVTAVNSGNKRYSITAHIPPLAITELWISDHKWPLSLDSDGAVSDCA